MTDQDPALTPTRRRRVGGFRHARRVGLTVLAFGLLAGTGDVLVAGVSGAASAQGALAASQPPYKGQTLMVGLAGRAGTRRVLIYRNTPTDSAQIPVVYLLHGVPGRPEDFQSSGLIGALDHYAATGGRPLVVAVPDGKGSAHYDTEWADSADGRDRLESFLLKKVLPAVEGSKPRDMAHRAIAGFSMGGYGAANIALRHPTLFGALVAIAGYYHVDDPSGVFAGQPRRIAANSPDRHVGQARRVRVLLTDGQEENESLIRGEADRFAALLRHRHVPVTVLETPGRHDLRYLRGQLPGLLTFLARGWPADQSTPARAS